MTSTGRVSLQRRTLRSPGGSEAWSGTEAELGHELETEQHKTSARNFREPFFRIAASSHSRRSHEVCSTSPEVFPGLKSNRWIPRRAVHPAAGRVRLSGRSPSLGTRLYAGGVRSSFTKFSVEEGRASSSSSSSWLP